MFPLKDENPHPPGFKPKLTILLMVINVAIFFYEIAYTGQFWEFSNNNAAQLFYEWGAVPACITGASNISVNGIVISCPDMSYASL
ncbi:MAG: rhomboid family intramembrane serine protease, partial [Nitrosopumilaceae archaeon]